MPSVAGSRDVGRASRKEITVAEMRRHLSTLEELLEREGELIVTRHGKPIARLASAGPRPRRPSHADFRARLMPLQEGSEVYVRADRDER